jgi:hypothetical protein
MSPRLVLPGFAALFFIHASAAQQQITSPAGYLAVEGQTNFFHFGSGGARRFQQIDATHVGSGGFFIQSIAFRRDAGPYAGGFNVPPCTMDLEITMGEANMGLVSARFDDNFLPGTRQIVFGKKQVNRVDWTGNVGTPAPFDFVIYLDTPFAYSGQSALVIEFTYENLVWLGAATGVSSLDRVFLPYTQTAAVNLGQGCSASGQTIPFTHQMSLQNGGGGPLGMLMQVDAYGAPGNSAVWLLMDSQNLNQAVPGLCATLHSGGLAVLPLRVTEPSGTMRSLYFSFPHDSSLIGAPVVTQLVSLDFNLPIGLALSNGRQATIPADPSAGASPLCAYHWDSVPTAHATLFFGGGIAIRLGIL